MGNSVYLLGNNWSSNCLSVLAQNYSNIIWIFTIIRIKSASFEGSMWRHYIFLEGKLRKPPNFLCHIEILAEIPPSGQIFQIVRTESDLMRLSSTCSRMRHLSTLSLYEYLPAIKKLKIVRFNSYFVVRDVILILMWDICEPKRSSESSWPNELYQIWSDSVD